MLERVIASFSQELDLNAEQIADLLWLMTISQPPPSDASNLDAPSTPLNQSQAVQAQNRNFQPSLDSQLEKMQDDGKQSNKEIESQQGAPIRPRQTGKPGGNQSLADRARRPIKIPDSASLRAPLNLSRALRSLIRQVPTGMARCVDERATVKRISEEQIWIPVTQPELEPWLDVVIVVDEHLSMQVWRRTVQEFRNLLAGYGAFRDVQLYGLVFQARGSGKLRDAQAERQFYLRPNWGFDAPASDLLKPECLIDPNQRRLILMVSDCVAPYWWNGQILAMLQKWSLRGMAAVVQMLPEWLWDRTALREADRVLLGAVEAGVVNQQLLAKDESDGRVVMPILALEPDWLLSWSRMVAGIGDAGMWGWLLPDAADLVVDAELDQLSVQQRLDFFRLGASPLARQLIGFLAATPVITLPVIRLVQAAMLPKSNQVQVAEVLLGGLLCPKPGQTGPVEEWVYEFVDAGIRKELLKDVPVSSTVRVLSRYIEKQFDLSLRDFIAELQSELSEGDSLEALEPFAIVAADVLRRKGKEYEGFIQTVDRYYPQATVTTSQTLLNELQEFEFEFAEYVEVGSPVEPQLQTFEFDVLTFRKGDEEIQETTPDPLASLNWQRFSFTVATLDAQNRLRTADAAAWMYTVEIDPARRLFRQRETITLEMVAVPGGEFLMGSDENSSERPVHSVTVPSFFMSRYPVTQDLWRIVALLPRVNRDLQPESSRFKEKNRPVEQVSWDDAVEFCARLSKHTGREYRLPTEAEWEYACRAGTTTKYHFGDEITKELANYSGKETTIVGKFPYVNSFGLSDMHGNVWEWCMDHWHDSYQGAPSDGSAWIDARAKEDARRVLRGGSWNADPWVCRSASRLRYRAGSRYDFIGFRLLSPARILL